MIRFVDPSVAIQDTPNEATPVTVNLLDHRTGATMLGLPRRTFRAGLRSLMWDNWRNWPISPTRTLYAVTGFTIACLLTVPSRAPEGLDLSCRDHRLLGCHDQRLFSISTGCQGAR